RRRRMRYFQVFLYGHGLADRQIAVDQRGHQGRWIQRTIAFRQLMPAILQQMHRHRLVGQDFQVQGYAHAVGGGAAKVAVQLHGVSLIFLESSLGKGKETFSGVPSSVRTEMAPSSFSRSTTWRTNTSGAEA